jgi:hypothetical protein
MTALVILLTVLLNLSFGETQMPSDAPSKVIDELVKQYQESLKKIRMAYGIAQGEGCKKAMEQLKTIAAKHGMLMPDEGRAYIRFPDNKGFWYYQADGDSCRIIAYAVEGTLSPPSPSSVAPIGQQILTKQDLKFGVDVSLFRVLFQLLMYGAGIFWVVRAAQKFIAGYLTDALITFFIGFVIVASMYVLYRWMPA